MRQSLARTVKKISKKCFFFPSFPCFTFQREIFSTVCCLSGKKHKTIDIISIISHSGYYAKMANYLKSLM